MANEAKRAYDYTKYRIIKLTESKNKSVTRAILSKLRRGIGKAPGSMPELWDITLGELPETLLSKGDNPTYGEWAVYTALTLFALHQQGKDIKRQCMSKDSSHLGNSVKKLIQQDNGNENAVTRRFVVAATSDSIEELSHHLRGIVQLLKAKDIPLDYPALSEDLFWFQFSDKRDSVRLRWGQDFYRLNEIKVDTDLESEERKEERNEK